MDPIKTIGTVLSDTETRRDAIHIAIVPVILGEDHLYSGNPVKLVYGTTNIVKRADYGDHIGVIDPFPKKDLLRKGDKVWLFLNPNTVTGMRHEWTHPAFDQQRPPVNESEEWLRRFACKWNFNYDEMVKGATRGDCVTAMGVDLHGASELDPGEEELFWHHLEALTGEKFSTDHKNGFEWSCRC